MRTRTTRTQALAGVTALLAAGAAGGSLALAPVAAAATATPTITGVSATGVSTVSVTWTRVTDVSSYDLYIDGNQEATLTCTTGTTCTTALSPYRNGTVVQLAARGSDGSTSPLSAPATIGKVRIDLSNGSRLVRAGQQVPLGGRLVTDDGAGSPMPGWRIRITRHPQSGADVPLGQVVTDGTGAFSFSPVTVTTGDKIQLDVDGVGGVVGDETRYEPTFTDGSVPNASGLTVSGPLSDVRVRWSGFPARTVKISNEPYLEVLDGSSVVAGYSLPGPTPRGSRVDVQRGAYDENTASLTGLVAGHRYTVLLGNRTYDRTASSPTVAYSVPLVATYLAPLPGQPSGIVIRARAGVATVSWPPVDAADRYRVAGNGRSWVTGDTSLALGDLPAGQLLPFTVAGENDNGKSTATSFTVDTRSPASPQAVSLGLAGSASVLSWQAPGFVGGSGIETYVVTRDGAEIGRTSALSLVLPGTPGTYGVQAVNAWGVGPQVTAVLSATTATLKASAASVPFGSTLTLSGVVGGAAKAGRTVTVYARTSTKAPWRTAGVAMSTAKGAWVLALRPGGYAEYFARVGATPAAASTDTGRVHASVTARVLVTVKATRRTATIAASVGAARRNAPVSLQQLVGKRWTTIGVAKTSTKSVAAWKLSFRAAGRYTYRVSAPAYGLVGPGVSKPFTVTVR